MCPTIRVVSFERSVHLDGRETEQAIAMEEECRAAEETAAAAKKDYIVALGLDERDKVVTREEKVKEKNDTVVAREKKAAKKKKKKKEVVVVVEKEKTAAKKKKVVQKTKTVNTEKKNWTVKQIERTKKGAKPVVEYLTWSNPPVSFNVFRNSKVIYIDESGSEKKEFQCVWFCKLIVNFLGFSDAIRAIHNHANEPRTWLQLRKEERTNKIVTPSNWRKKTIMISQFDLCRLIEQVRQENIDLAIEFCKKYNKTFPDFKIYPDLSNEVVKYELDVEFIADPKKTDENEELKNVLHVYRHNGVFWFVGTEIARSFGYKDPPHSLHHVKDADHKRVWNSFQSFQNRRTRKALSENTTMLTIKGIQILYDSCQLISKRMPDFFLIKKFYEKQIGKYNFK